MQQIFSYPDNLPSVMSGNQHLDNFEDSSVHFHWHTEFQFGLILSGKINYSIFRSLVNQECSELSVGDGFLLTQKYCTDAEVNCLVRTFLLLACRQLILHPMLLGKPMKRSFSLWSIPELRGSSSCIPEKKINRSLIFSVNFTIWRRANRIMTYNVFS